MGSYADFIKLNTNFKPVFHLERDAKDENLWKRFVFTEDFKALLAKLGPVFGNDQNRKKAYMMTGRYGVGKSHATAVLSHLLWDNCEDIHEKLEEANREMGEWGQTLNAFRQKQRLFPVILTQRNSKNVTTAQDFELELQRALEKALSDNGYQDSISEKTNFVRYIDWLNDLLADDKRRQILDYMNEFFASNSYFEDATQIISALDDRDKQALKTIEEAFLSLKIPPPQHIDTIQYYKNVLKELQARDPSIAGIVIYWDEFTTVFNTAGRYSDTTLIGAIQTWAEAELLSSNIYLFLVSHRSPEQFRGMYKHIESDLALIQQRFHIVEMSLDKIMTYHLMAATLEIPEESRWKEFLTSRGFSLDEAYNTYLIRDTFGDLFGEISSHDEKYIRKTVPFHPYAVYIASRISKLIGSAERSIFELIYDPDKETYEWGNKIGFSYFLSNEPADDTLAWYRIDNLFDYFFPILDDDEIEYINKPNVKKAINFFRQYFAVAHNLGENHFRVFKTVILLECLHALTFEEPLLPSDINLKKAFLFTDVGDDLNLILNDLKDAALLIAHETRSGQRFYKTPYAGTDEREITEEIEHLSHSNSFKQFVNELTPTVESYCSEALLMDIPRVKNQQVNYTVLAAEDINRKETKLRQLGLLNFLDLAIIIPKDYSEIQDARTKLQKLSNEVKNVIFILFEGNFEKRYEGWIRATATCNVAQKKDNQEMFRDAQSRIEALYNDFTDELVKADVFFRGRAEAKAEGLEREIKRHAERIFYKGFERHDYQQFWTTRNSSKSRLILEAYGQPTGKQQILDGSAMERRMLEIFQSENEDPYLDSCLHLRDEYFVSSSNVYEIVTRIRDYVREKNGERFNVGRMIQDVCIEEPPYGLCGWMESIIITYALAEFYAESRLEVVNGNGTPSKDATRIVEVINAAIRGRDSDRYLRYGSPDEEWLRKKLNQMFNFDPEKKTLKEISFAIRGLSNDSGVPLWSIPYVYVDEAKRSDTHDLVYKINELVNYINNDKEYIELVGDLKERIKRFEYTYGGQIWIDMFRTESLKAGFKKYVSQQNERLITQYPDFDALIIDLKTKITNEPWLWQEWRVHEALNSLLITEPPSPPQQVIAKLERGGVVIAWGLPPNDSPAPTRYIIERLDKDGSNVPIDIIGSGTTRYRDQSVSPGETYRYCVKAQNAAGISDMSVSAEIEVIPDPPKLILTAQGHDDYIELLWSTPESYHKIARYDIYRGPTPTNAKHLGVAAKDDSSYKDTSVARGVKYYYVIKATNIYGLEGQASAPSEARTNPLAIRPTTPQHLSALVDDSNIRLTWSPPESGSESVEGYLIYRSENTEEFSLIDKVPQNSNEYVDRTVKSGVKYAYTVSATNSSGESAQSIAVTQKVLPAPPGVNLSVESREDSIVLRWDPIDTDYEITKYLIYRGRSADSFTDSTHVLNSESCYVDDSVEVGQTYCYKVTAVNIQGVEGTTSIPKAVIPRVSVDVNKWKEESISVAIEDLRIYLGTFSNILKSVASSRTDLSMKQIQMIKTIQDAISEGLYE